MLPLKPHTIAWLVAGEDIPTMSFNTQRSLTTRKLTHALDSLVRVSRRVERCPFTSYIGLHTRIGSTPRIGSGYIPKETNTLNVSEQQSSIHTLNQQASMLRHTCSNTQRHEHAATATQPLHNSMHKLACRKPSKQHATAAIYHKHSNILRFQFSNFKHF